MLICHVSDDSKKKKLQKFFRSKIFHNSFVLARLRSPILPIFVTQSNWVSGIILDNVSESGSQIFQAAYQMYTISRVLRGEGGWGGSPGGTILGSAFWV